MTEGLNNFAAARETVRDYVLQDEFFAGLEFVLPVNGLIAPAVMKAQKKIGCVVMCDGFDLPNPSLGCSTISLAMRLGFYEDVRQNRPQSEQAAAVVQYKTLEQYITRFYGGFNPVRSASLGAATLVPGSGRYLTREGKLRTFEVNADFLDGWNFTDEDAPPAPVGPAQQPVESLEDARRLVGDFFGNDDFFAGGDIILPTDGLIKPAVEEAKSALGVAISIDGVDVTGDAPSNQSLELPVILRFFENVSLNRPQSANAAAVVQYKTLEEWVERTLALFNPVYARRFGGSPMLIKSGRYTNAVGTKITFDVSGVIRAGWLNI